MKRKMRWLAVAGVAAWAVAGARPLSAQAGSYEQVLSANPFGILLEFFNAEYERGMTTSSTWGIGGSYGRGEDEDELGVTRDSEWFNGDLFFRYYPSGLHFQGWNFGIKAGLTHQETFDGSGTNFGIGFDANRSWLLGRNENFYVGIGFGLKRLFGDVPAEGIEVVPTLRIVNVGFAF